MKPMSQQTITYNRVLLEKCIALHLVKMFSRFDVITQTITYNRVLLEKCIAPHLVKIFSRFEP
jgi:hypothetical protein